MGYDSCLQANAVCDSGQCICSGTLVFDANLNQCVAPTNGKAIVFFLFFFTDFFCNKLVSEDEIKIKIKFIRTIFQLN